MWVFSVLFVIHGVEGVRDSIPADTLPFIDALLTFAGIYFRVSPAQKFTK